MPRKEDCIRCKKAKFGGYAGEIRCSFYGRKPQFDDSPCPNFLESEESCRPDKGSESVSSKLMCPECGQEVSQTLNACPNCGFPLMESKTENCAHYESEPKFNDNTSPNLSKSDVSRHSDCGCESVSSKFRCPECGQEVSQTLSTCPNCGFPLIENECEKLSGEQKSQVEDTLCPNIKDSGDARSNPEEQKTQSAPSPKTAADIINEHKQKEDDLREIIREKYNIVGDISEEQYKQLLIIYNEEEKGTRPSNTLHKQPTKKKISDTMIAVIILACIVLGVAAYEIIDYQIKKDESERRYIENIQRYYKERCDYYSQQAARQMAERYGRW